MQKNIEMAIEFIQSKAPFFQPKVAIILGSGLGPLADQIENPIEIAYGEIPGFHVSSVHGHAGKLFLGTLNGVPVACLKGRVHLYENPDFNKLKLMIRTLKVLGCNTLMMTNAAGSLNKSVGPGELSLITDHINFQGTNPLIGANDEDFGPRFPAMNNAYDAKLRQQIKAVAQKINVKLHEGVYLATLGPTFETPAEIRAFKLLGADLVGMSTVSENIVAVHCGMKVVAVSAIVNLGAGMVDNPPSHEETLHFADIASDNLIKLFKAFLTEHKNELMAEE
jgi:xanthosine phosphorylase